MERVFTNQTVCGNLETVSNGCSDLARVRSRYFLHRVCLANRKDGRDFSNIVFCLTAKSISEDDEICFIDLLFEQRCTNEVVV
jgi:hypothetical protein